MKYKDCCAYCSNFEKESVCKIDNEEVDIFCGCEDGFELSSAFGGDS